MQMKLRESGRRNYPMFNFRLTVAGSTHVGCVRTNNQDAYWVDEKSRFFILADGMGGYTGGEIASALTVETVAAYLDRALSESNHSIRLPQDWLNQATLQANTVVIRDAQANIQRADMGTTLVIVLPIRGTLWYAHVGDSRFYRWRDQSLQQLTGDHTLVADMVTNGLLEQEEARRHPYRNVLSRCLGRPELKSATVGHVEAQPADRYLLCSDGLTEEVTDAQITEILEQHADDQAACNALVALANAQGGHDNITVVVISVLAQISVLP